MVHISRNAGRFLIQYFHYCRNQLKLDYNHITNLVDDFIKTIKAMDSLSVDFYSDYRGYKGYKIIYKNKSTKSQWVIFYIKKDNDYWVYEILSSFQKLPPKINLRVKSKMRQ